MSDLVTRLSVLAEDDGDHYPTHVKKLAEAAASRITALDATLERAEKAEADRDSHQRLAIAAQTELTALKARVVELEGALGTARKGVLFLRTLTDTQEVKMRRIEKADEVLAVIDAALKEKPHGQG